MLSQIQVDLPPIAYTLAIWIVIIFFALFFWFVIILYNEWSNWYAKSVLIVGFGLLMIGLGFEVYFWSHQISHNQVVLRQIKVNANTKIHQAEYQIQFLNQKLVVAKANLTRYVSSNQPDKSVQEVYYIHKLHTEIQKQNLLIYDQSNLKIVAIRKAFQ